MYGLVLLIILVSCFKHVYAQRKSKVIITEVNVNVPEKPELKEFIELKSTEEGLKSVSLRGYKIIGLSAGGKTSSIELVIQPWNWRIQDTGLFTIGGSLVPGADEDLPNEYVSFRSQKVRGSISISNFSKNGQTKLNAIAILYDFNNWFEDIRLDEHGYLKVDDGDLPWIFQQKICSS